jgi:hypothetical protein
MKTLLSLGRGVILAVSILQVISCRSLPVINPAPPDAAINRQCGQPFFVSPYRFVHKIEVALPGGKTATLLGITRVEPQAGSVSSAITTVEGFLLFEARYDKALHVYRALPPFNTGNFAEQTMADIRLIFLAPAGPAADAGVLEDGAAICRYDGEHGKIVDVIVPRDDTWEIRTYSGRSLSRKISAWSVRDRLPGSLELTGFEALRYSLRFTLISAEPVEENLNIQ